MSELQIAQIHVTSASDSGAITAVSNPCNTSPSDSESVTSIFNPCNTPSLYHVSPSDSKSKSVKFACNPCNLSASITSTLNPLTRLGKTKSHLQPVQHLPSFKASLSIYTSPNAELVARASVVSKFIPCNMCVAGDDTALYKSSCNDSVIFSTSRHNVPF